MLIWVIVEVRGDSRGIFNGGRDEYVAGHFEWCAAGGVLAV